MNKQKNEQKKKCPNYLVFACQDLCGLAFGDKLFSNHLKECAILCQENESCSHWTWSMHDEDWGKYCWLKFSDEGWKPSRGTISGAKNCTSECTLDYY